jgi:hypothetical protein
MSDFFNVASSNAVSRSNALIPRQRIDQKCLLIWMDANIDTSNEDCQDKLAQLRSVINDVNIFTYPEECVDFLRNVGDRKVCMVAADSIAQHILPSVHDIPQLDNIYIYCDNQATYQQWAKLWLKIKGVHTSVLSICKALRPTVTQCDQDSISVSFITVDENTSSQDLNRLEPSFMYTQLFKETLLQIQFNQQSIKDFSNYCRKNDYAVLSTIDRFENEYRPQLAV